MKTISVNKKAYHNYFLSDELETGISLVGSEVKSIRNGHISLAESFVKLLLLAKHFCIMPTSSPTKTQVLLCLTVSVQENCLCTKSRF